MTFGSRSVVMAADAHVVAPVKVRALKGSWRSGQGGNAAHEALLTRWLSVCCTPSGHARCKGREQAPLPNKCPLRTSAPSPRQTPLTSCALPRSRHALRSRSLCPFPFAACAPSLASAAGGGVAQVGAGAMVADRCVLLPGSSVGRLATLGSGALAAQGCVQDGGGVGVAGLWKNARAAKIPASNAPHPSFPNRSFVHTSLAHPP